MPTYTVTPKTNATIQTSSLFRYFIPELITVTLLYIGLEIINFRFIACIDTSLCNSTLFVTSSLFHFITKVGEGFSVGLVILCGRYNGTKEFRKTGEILANAFWTTAVIGALVAACLYLGADAIYSFYEVPQEIVTLGVPYMRIRSLAVFFGFIYFALIGFLRGIKNPHVPMLFFILGAFVYLIADYALIFGAWGFPKMGLNGAAVASVIQFATMCIAATIYILFHNDTRKYSITLFRTINLTIIRRLISLSWPVTLDKASLALIPIWLNKMIGCTAKVCTIAESSLMYEGLTVLKTMERVGILPALAFAQVITFLISNDINIKSFTSLKSTIKKVLYLSSLLVGILTLAFCLWPSFFLTLLNKPHASSQFIVYTLPFVALLILCDVVQLILSASLRGGADVKTVMMSRALATFVFFIPLAYGITLLPIQSTLLKFVLLYSSVHVSFALMGIIYLLRLNSPKWTDTEIIPAQRVEEPTPTPSQEIQP